jgi:hypothetical protein
MHPLSRSHQTTNLMKPPAPQLEDPAEVAVASAVQVDLASLQAATQGAPLALGFVHGIHECKLRQVGGGVTHRKSQFQRSQSCKNMGMLRFLTTTSTSTINNTVTTLRLRPMHNLCSMHCRARAFAIFALHATSGESAERIFSRASSSTRVSLQPSPIVLSASLVRPPITRCSPTNTLATGRFTWASSLLNSF